MHRAQLAEALGSCSCGLAALSLIMQHCLMVDLCSDLRQDKGKILACPLSHLIRARLHHQRIWQRDWLSLCLSLWRANKASSSLQPMGRGTRLDKDKRRAVNPNHVLWCDRYKGVSPLRGKFQASIIVDGKKYALGSYATETEAAWAADEAHVYKVKFERVPKHHTQTLTLWRCCTWCEQAVIQCKW